MPSVTSCFNLALYRKNLFRFWPIWVLYTLIWLFILPITLLSHSANRYYASFNPLEWAGRQPLLVVGGGVGVVIAVIYGVLIAMAVFSYLYNHRSANLLHALPIRREGLFLTNYLSGVTFFVLPHLLVFVLTLAAEAAVGGLNVGALAACLGYQTLLNLFFFSFATLCAMLTGHLLALPAFYLIFNGLVFGFTALLDWMMSNFLFGFTGGLSNTELVTYLTPCAMLSKSFGYHWISETAALPAGALDYPVLEGVGVVWAYAGVGLVLTLLALLLYRVRHMETAGDVVAVPVIRPVFKYSVALCTALAGGCALYSILDLSGSTLFVVCLIFWCVIGYFAAAMLLKRSFKVFHAWRGCAVMVALLLVVSGVLKLDLFGVEGRVPAPEDVASVAVYGISSAPYDSASYLRVNEPVTDPAVIEKTVALHQAIVSRKDTLRDNSNGYYTETSPEDGVQSASGWIDVTYTLKNGSTMNRRYSYLPFTAAELNDPASITAAADALINDRSLLASEYRLDDITPNALLWAEVTSLVNDSGAGVGVTLDKGEDAALSAETAEAEKEYGASYSYHEGYAVLSVTPAQLEQVRQAVMNDFEAGRLGSRYLLANSDARTANTCLADLTFYFEVTKTERDGTVYRTSESVSITLTPQATETIAALKQAGVFDTGLKLVDNNGAVVY